MQLFWLSDSFSVYIWLYSEIAWVLVSTEIQDQQQIILDLDYFLDNLSVSYNYVVTYFLAYYFEKLMLHVLQPAQDIFKTS